MIVNKQEICEKYAEAVKNRKYKKIDYNLWRNLRDATPDDWELSMETKLSVSEASPTTIEVSWENCISPYEFNASDGAFGAFLFETLYPQTYTIATNSSTISDAFSALTDSCNTFNKVWDNAITSTYTLGGWGSDSISSTNISMEVKEGNFYIDGKRISEIVDEATGASIRKENEDMNLIKNFDFGSCANDNVKVSMYGIAVKNSAGTWVSYDASSGSVMDVDVFNIDGKYLYKMPVAIKDIAAGDTVIHNRKPMFVSKVEDGKILAIDPAAGEEKVIMLTRNMFGFDFATKVVNLFEGFMGSANADTPFGNILPLMLMNDGKVDDMLPIMLMSGGKMDMSNPMVMYFLMKDNKGGGNDILPFLMMMNSTGKCTCDCDREG